jgi:hypothetical protein
MKRLFRQTLFSLLLAVVLTSALFGGASAQAGFALSINLPRTETAVGGQAAVSVVVSDAVNLNAFDIELTYDPQVLTLTNWGFGSFLTQLAQVVLENEPGRFHLVATQLAQPGKTGSGALIELRFTGLKPGESALTLTKGELAEPQGALSYPSLNGGVVRVEASATAAPTATRTPNPTPTATLAGGRTYPTGAAPTNTPGPGGGLPILTQAPEPTKRPDEGMPTWAVTEPLAGTLTLEQPTEPFAPGAEKTRQAGHYATLMAQVAQMTAVSAGLNAPKARPGGTSPAALVTGVVIAAGVLVIALIIALLIRRKKQKQEGIHGN